MVTQLPTKVRSDVWTSHETMHLFLLLACLPARTPFLTKKDDDGEMFRVQEDADILR